MKRREVLKYTAMLSGASIAVPFSLSFLAGCEAKVHTAAHQKDYSSTFFTSDQFEFVQELIDLILPKSESPSATEVGVHRMIDTMVGKVYKKEDQEDYKKGFEALSKYLNKEKKFGDLKKEQVSELLKSLETSKDEKLTMVKEAYQHLKQQSIAYYLNTEEVATEFLNYLPIPGPYEACISLDSVGGKKWAS